MPRSPKLVVVWRDVAALSMHPTQVLIVEALSAGEPMSPSEIFTTHEAAMPKLTLGTVSYHMRMLRERQVVTLVSSEPRRGALEHFYLLAPGLLVRANPPKLAAVS